MLIKHWINNNNSYNIQNNDDVIDSCHSLYPTLPIVIGYVLPVVMKSLPRHRLNTYGCRAFAVAGPTVWNSLPEDMQDTEVSDNSYGQPPKTF